MVTSVPKTCAICNSDMKLHRPYTTTTNYHCPNTVDHNYHVFNPLEPEFSFKF
jgi:hypothetical protein